MKSMNVHEAAAVAAQAVAEAEAAMAEAEEAAKEAEAAEAEAEAAQAFAEEASKTLKGRNICKMVKKRKKHPYSFISQDIISMRELWKSQNAFVENVIRQMIRAWGNGKREKKETKCEERVERSLVFVLIILFTWEVVF